ncbi:hypothetical protein [Advenella sp. FME57]|nr:hypothetical protein [Advenella sp. FME57]
MQGNPFSSVSMLIAVCIALLAQIATLVLAAYIYFKPLSYEYFDYLPWLQLSLIPCGVLCIRMSREQNRQLERIIQYGVDGRAKVLTIEPLGAGDEVMQYYTFTVKADFQSEKIEIVDAITIETYKDISAMDVVPIRYIPNTCEVIILFDHLNQQKN